MTDTAMDLQSAMKAWRVQLGEDAVLSMSEATRQYGQCTIVSSQPVSAAVIPQCKAQVSEIVCTANSFHVPLYPISTGKNWGYGSALPVERNSVILDLSRLTEITLDKQFGVVTVEPGVTQRHLSERLAQEEANYLVPVTGAGPNCSLLGNALERGYGITPYPDHFSAVMSLEAVLPDGRVYHSALSEMACRDTTDAGDVDTHDVDKLYKWGVGPYLDGLFSQGGFGVVTQMTIALAPVPERIEAFFFSVGETVDVGAVTKRVRTLLTKVGANMGAINLLNERRVLSMMEPYPKDLGPGCIIPDELVANMARRNHVTPWTGVGAIYGQKNVVAATRKVIRKELGPIAKRLNFLTQERSQLFKKTASSIPVLRQSAIVPYLGKLVATLQLIAGKPRELALPLAYWKSGATSPSGMDLDPARDGCGLVWFAPLVPMEPKRVRRYIELIRSVCEEHNMEPLITLTSLSDRCFDSTVPLLFNQRDEREAKNARQCYDALFEHGKQEGFLPYRFNVHSMAQLQESAAPFFRLVGELKHAIDPSNIMAPGRYSAPPAPSEPLAQDPTAVFSGGTGANQS